MVVQSSRDKYCPHQSSSLINGHTQKGQPFNHMYIDNKKNMASTVLSISEKSREISKIKPKIRIIQIIDPEIIKTDATNFRELVQSLTGQSSIRRKSRRNKNKIKNKNKNLMGLVSTTTSTRSNNIVYDHLQKGMPLLESQYHNEISKRPIMKDEIIKEEIYQPWEGDVMINTDFGTGFFSDMDLLSTTTHDHQDLAGFPSTMFSGKPSNVNLFNGPLC